MTNLSSTARAVPLSIRATAVVASAVVKAARQLLTDLEQGRRVDAAVLRNAMEAAFGASDATGAWNWKMAYDACEAATVLFLRRHGAAMRAKAASPAAMLPMLQRITSLLPTQTRRSEESKSLQQFSTPIGLAYVASVAAAITPADVVLEPSAGTGLLAIFAELAGASLVLNEFAESRAGILSQLFPAVSTTRFDAAHINDHLDAGMRAECRADEPAVLGRGPCRSPDAQRRRYGTSDRLWPVFPKADGSSPSQARASRPTIPHGPTPSCGCRNRAASFSRRRLMAPSMPSTAPTIDTRLTVIDRVPADDSASFPASPALRPTCRLCSAGSMQHVPPRRPIAGTPRRRCQRLPASQRLERSALTSASVRRRRSRRPSISWRPKSPTSQSTGCPRMPARSPMRFMRPIRLQSIRIPGAQAHPTKLVQSAAMASVAPPKPSYRPHLPANVVDGWHSVGRPARERHLCRRGAFGVSRRLLDGRCDV